MADQSWEKTFDAKIAEVPAMMDYVAGIAESLELHPKRVMHLQLAVEEAVVNVCNYAYEVPPGDVTLALEVEATRFIIRIIDAGIPFDPLKLDEPDLKAEVENRQIGGLGVYLMRRVMDEVHYFHKDGKNILTLVMNLSS